MKSIVAPTELQTQLHMSFSLSSLVCSTRSALEAPLLEEFSYCNNTKFWSSTLTVTALSALRWSAASSPDLDLVLRLGLANGRVEDHSERGGPQFHFQQQHDERSEQLIVLHFLVVLDELRLVVGMALLDHRRYSPKPKAFADGESNPPTSAHSARYATRSLNQLR